MTTKNEIKTELLTNAELDGVVGGLNPQPLPPSPPSPPGEMRSHSRF
jgi:hypothetical protein